VATILEEQKNVGSLNAHRDNETLVLIAKC